MLADIVDMVGSIAYAVLDVASVTLWSKDADVRVPETLITFGLIAVMLVFALALSSWIVGCTALILPWIIRARLRRMRRDGHHERHQRHLYTAVAFAFGAALLLELGVAIAASADAITQNPTLLAQIPDLAITHIAVATAFPAVLWLFWKTKNRMQAAGGGLLAAGLIAQAVEQAVRGGTIAWKSTWPFTIDLMLFGMMVLALGTMFASAPLAIRREGASRRDLRKR